MRAMRATIYMRETVALNGLNRLLVKTTLPEEVAIKRTPYSNDRILYLDGGDLNEDSYDVLRGLTYVCNTYVGLV